VILDFSRNDIPRPYFPVAYNGAMPEFDIAGVLRTISVFLIPGLFAITLHEVAHGWAARQLGDRTAEMLGRLSVNPLKHVDPVGTVLVPLASLVFTNFLFGWAKPVPVAFRNLRNPRRGRSRRQFCHGRWLDSDMGRAERHCGRSRWLDALGCQHVSDRRFL